MRGDDPSGLSAAGWAALERHGVRTVVNLRNDDELEPDLALRPPSLATVHLPLDNVEDEFWDDWANGPQYGTPVYYRPFLERFPDRAAETVAAVARAEPGGVLVHCGGGRDRTGLITMLLLTVAGVAPGTIADDYALSFERLPARYAALGEDDQNPVLEDYLRRRGTTPRGAALEAIDGLDAEATLRAGGLGDEDLAALRARLVER